MALLTRWGRPSVPTLRREINDVLEDFTSPRALRREIDQLFGEELSPRSIWQEMQSLFDDFVTPSPLRRRIGALFEPFGVGIGVPALGLGSMRGMFVPEVELVERDNAYALDVDLPGIRQEDIQISVDDYNVLTIRGERRGEEKKRARGYEYSERSYGSFSRSIELPRGVDTSKIDADYHDGVLSLHIPKTEQAMARKIPISGREAGRELGQGRESGRESGKDQPRVMSPENVGGSEKRERTQANAR